MCRVEPGPALLGNQPVLRERHTVDHRAALFLVGRPFFEVYRSREWREEDELRERQIGALSERHRRVEAVLRVARQPEDERAEDVNPVAAKGAQARRELLAGKIEAF